MSSVRCLGAGSTPESSERNKLEQLEAKAWERLLQACSEAGVNLPPGWRLTVKQRTTGSSKGDYDYYYYSPGANSKRFRSQKEVVQAILGLKPMSRLNAAPRSKHDAHHNRHSSPADDGFDEAGAEEHPLGVGPHAGGYIRMLPPCGTFASLQHVGVVGSVRTAPTAHVAGCAELDLSEEEAAALTLAKGALLQQSGTMLPQQRARGRGYRHPPQGLPHLQADAEDGVAGLWRAQADSCTPEHHGSLSREGSPSLDDQEQQHSGILAAAEAALASGLCGNGNSGSNAAAAAAAAMLCEPALPVAVAAAVQCRDRSSSDEEGEEDGVAVARIMGHGGHLERQHQHHQQERRGQHSFMGHHHHSHHTGAGGALLGGRGVCGSGGLGLDMLCKAAQVAMGNGDSCNALSALGTVLEEPPVAAAGADKAVNPASFAPFLLELAPKAEPEEEDAQQQRAAFAVTDDIAIAPMLGAGVPRKRRSGGLAGSCGADGAPQQGSSKQQRRLSTSGASGGTMGTMPLCPGTLAAAAGPLDLLPICAGASPVHEGGAIVVAVNPSAPASPDIEKQRAASQLLHNAVPQLQRMLRMVEGLQGHGVSGLEYFSAAVRQVEGAMRALS